MDIRYHNSPKYWDRPAWTNNVDPDQMLQNAASNQGYTTCHLSSIILDTSTVGKAK